eukprot:7383446-Prymnesium_polylepis.4
MGHVRSMRVRTSGASDAAIWSCLGPVMTADGRISPKMSTHVTEMMIALFSSTSRSRKMGSCRGADGLEGSGREWSAAASARRARWTVAQLEGKERGCASGTGAAARALPHLDRPCAFARVAGGEVRRAGDVRHAGDNAARGCPARAPPRWRRHYRGGGRRGGGGGLRRPGALCPPTPAPTPSRPPA